MYKVISQVLKRSLAVSAATALFAACSDEAPVAPDRLSAASAQLAAIPAADKDQAIVTLKRVTARYHNIEAAFRDGFVLLHECETRPQEGPVGTVYVHIGRLMDGVIDATAPDALIYEPQRNGPPKLVGVEFAIPYGLWPQQTPPTFLGATFQPEDEFGVYALHAWVWRSNPDGLFAESNPRVSCLTE